MIVNYIGFGGGYTEYPCYEDEKGRIYFDINNGRGALLLCSGAYRDEEGLIEGEPYCVITEKVECNNPFKRHLREFDYNMLGRLESDCKYFLGNGNGYVGHLYFEDINEQCDEMKKIYLSFSDEDKPEWLSLEQIEDYRCKMLNISNKKAV